MSALASCAAPCLAADFYVFALIGWDFFPDLHDPVVEAVAHIVFFGLPLALYLANDHEGHPRAEARAFSA